MEDDQVGPEASPNGIADCLRMLAEEAASLRLVRTLMALLETMEICQVEASGIPRKPGRPRPSEPIEQPALVVH